MADRHVWDSQARVAMAYRHLGDRSTGVEPLVRPCQNRSVFQRPDGNRATRAAALVTERISADDWEQASALFTEAVNRIDRRPLGGPPVSGRDEFLRSARAFLDVGFDRSTSAVVAERGETVSLTETRLFLENGFVVEWLQITQVDAAGLMSQLVYFDIDDRVRALEELDALAR